MSGYSGTPLAKKLGIKAGMVLHIVNAPCDYAALVEGLPEEAVISAARATELDLVHIFTKSRPKLLASLKAFPETDQARRDHLGVVAQKIIRDSFRNHRGHHP